MWAKLLALIAAILLIWFLIIGIRRNPDKFSKESLSKSLTTMGMLALLLILFVTFGVMLLRSS